MYRDNSNTYVNLRKQSPQTLYRGLYVRIARKLGVDASYVSRVARGDRRSPEVESALHQALAEIDQQLGRSSSAAEKSTERKASSAKRLRDLVKQNRGLIQKQWFTHSQADPDLSSVKIGAKKRTAPILPVIEESMKAMRLNLSDMATAPMKAAAQHGRLRQRQGFTPMGLIEEYNLVRRCVFALAQENLRQMDAQVLLQDLAQFGEALDLQTQRALRNYLEAN
jgi:transcriptional regulator with XRE-family HTH domain